MTPETISQVITIVLLWLGAKFILGWLMRPIYRFFPEIITLSRWISRVLPRVLVTNQFHKRGVLFVLLVHVPLIIFVLLIVQLVHTGEGILATVIMGILTTGGWFAHGWIREMTLSRWRQPGRNRRRGR